jgi:hypothetical protein
LSAEETASLIAALEGRRGHAWLRAGHDRRPRRGYRKWFRVTAGKGFPPQIIIEVKWLHAHRSPPHELGCGESVFCSLKGERTNRWLPFPPDIIGCDEAKALGLKRFFTGEPCKRGHVAERYVSGGGCVECDRARALEWRAANTEKARKRSREGARKYRAANPEKDRERKREWRAANP